MHTIAGQQFRQFAHIALPIRTTHTQRMQLQHLSGQVLVQPAPASFACRRVRPEAADLIQIVQHHRMAHYRDQHVAEASRNVRPNCLRLECRRHEQLARIASSNGEVIRPECAQPLKEPMRRHGALKHHARGIPDAIAAHLLAHVLKLRGLAVGLALGNQFVQPPAPLRQPCHRKQQARACAGSNTVHQITGVAGHTLISMKPVSEPDCSNRAVLNRHLNAPSA